MKILVIDDELEWREDIVDTLRKLNIPEVETASSANEAIEILKNNPSFDRIICDSLDGDWILIHEALREREKTEAMRVLSGSSDMLAEVMEVGLKGLYKHDYTESASERLAELIGPLQDSSRGKETL